MTSFITKKLLPLLLCAAMVFGLLPVSAFAEEPESAEATEVSPVSDDQDNAPSVGDNQDNTTGDEAEPVTVSEEYGNGEVIYATGLGLTGIKVWWNEDDWTSVLETYSAYDVTLSGYTGGTVLIAHELTNIYAEEVALFLLEKDGSIVPVSDFQAEDFDWGCTVTFTVEADTFTFAAGIPTESTGIPAGAELTGLSLSGPSKTMYFPEEQAGDGNLYIDLSGLTVTAWYSYEDAEYSRVLEWNQFDETVDGYALTADDMTTPGRKTVTVSYGGKSASFTLWVCQEQMTDEDTGVSIRFETENVVSVTAEVVEPDRQMTMVARDLFAGDYMVYDITAEYARNADKLTGIAMVTLPIPEGVENPVVYYISDSRRVVTNMNAMNNGDGTVTFAAEHFSEYVIGEEIGADGLKNKTCEGSETKSVWMLASSLSSGTKYLIVSRNTAGSGHALTNNNGSIDNTAVTVISDGTNTYIETADTSLQWTFTGSSNNNWTITNDNYYLYRSNSEPRLTNNSSSNNISWVSGTNSLSSQGRSNTYYLTYNSGWTLSSSSSSKVYFYSPSDITSSGTYSVEGSASSGLVAMVDQTAELSYGGYFTPTSGNSTSIVPDEWTVAYSIETDENGVVSSISGSTAVLSGKSGTAVLKVTLVNKGNPDWIIWDQFSLIVTAPTYAVSIDSVDSLPIGAPVQLTASVTANSTAITPAAGSITWTSSDESIATVDENGVVTGQSAGDVTITATYTNPDGTTCTAFTSFTAQSATYSISIDEPETATVKQGLTLDLNATVLAGTVAVSNPIITWSSSDKSIATVDANGVVTGQSAGDVTITASYTDPEGNILTDTQAITVATATWSLNLHYVTTVLDGDGNVTSYTKGEEITAPITKKNVKANDVDHSIWAAIYTDDEDIGQLTADQLSRLNFTSSNESIATVDSKNGQVTFHGGTGTVVITATYEYAEGKYVSDTVIYSVTDDSYYVPEDGTDDFPEYPNQGSIRFDKTATAVGNFSETGIAKVELSMTGVPVTTNHAMDVVVMLDMTGSMSANGMTAAEEATVAFVETIVKNKDGTYNDNRVAVYAFNSGNSSPYELVALTSISSDTALATANTAIETASTKQSSGGTPFDEAAEKCYDVLKAAKTDGTGNDRQQFCVFMSDGGPTTYYGSDQKTYYGGNNTSGDITLTSVMTGYSSSVSSDWSFTLPTEYYTDLMKKDGVTVYTVGLLLQNAPSNPAPYSSMTGSTYDSTTDSLTTIGSHYYFTSSILKQMATDESKYIDIFNVDNADNATEKFQAIATSILMAAEDVKVEDKISDNYTMIFDFPNDAVSNELGGSQDFYIEVLDYALNAVTNSEGVITDYTRGTATSLMKIYLGKNTETDGTVTYYAASDSSGNAHAAPVFDTTALGSLYYWSTDSAKGDKGISVKDANDITYYFVSDGTGTHNMTSGAYAYGTPTTETVTIDDETTTTTTLCKDLIIATPYFVYSADTRLLVWTAEKLTSNELALSYFLYLEKSAGYIGSDQALTSGTYETNDYADLTYTNINDNPCKQEMPVPQITWNGAQVSYVFYLVNSYGQPVNRAGRVVPFSEAVYVTDVFTYEVTWDALHHVESMQAEHLAQDLIDASVFQLYDSKATYTIHVFADEEKSNLNNHFVIGGEETFDTTYVFNTKADAEKYSSPGVYIANDGDDSNASTTYLCKSYSVDSKVQDGKIISATYTGAEEQIPAKDLNKTDATEINGYLYYIDEDGEVYTIVQKSDGKEVRTGFDFSNTTVAFAVVWLPELKPDTVVIDYGLDVVIDVTANDALASGVVGVRTSEPEAEIYKGQVSTPLKTSLTDLELNDTKVATATLENLTSVRVSLDKTNGMQLTAPLTFFYESDVSFYSSVKYNSESSLSTVTMYSSVTVIPATTVYYEDEYVTLKTYTQDSNGDWSATDGWTTNSVTSTAVQATDRPGTSKISQAYDADNNYGYDGAYADSSTYSLGNSAVATVTASTQAIAEFSFYGTRCDVIGLTSSNTGSILIKVFEGGSTEGTLLKAAYFVDTYFGYKFEDGEWKLTSPDDPNAIYQVPVMTVEDLDYGLYTVQIGAMYSAYDQSAGYDDSLEFYLDAIRVYDPMGQLDNTDYKADNESWPTYEELRNNLISAESFGSTETKQAGAVFIDGKGDITDVSDYSDYGPNNEVYLAPGQAVSFNLTVPATALDLQLGLKLANGSSASYTIYNVSGDAVSNQISGTMLTATDMYYSIWDLKDQTIVIKNTGDSGILSITNFKITHSENPASANTADLLWVDSTTVGYALRSLRSSIPAVPDETTPAETEPVETEPAETEPTETEPTETEPTETEPTETEPTETEPAETEPTETEPTETEPTETEPTETEPTETEPAETEPTETEPTETEPTETEPTETEPTETEPAETEPTETEPTETEPAETEPAEPLPSEPEEEPFDPDSVELPFSDVTEKDWFRDSVAYVYHHKLMQGVSDSDFAPHATATRAMIVTVLYRLEGSPAVSGSTAFQDVPDGTWYTDAVLWASGEGIVNGLSATAFGPDQNVTREQLATMLCRYLAARGIDTASSASLSGFPDAALVSPWAESAMQWAIANGIITGSSDGSSVTLQPGANALRSQIAAILQRFCEKY